MPRFAIYLIIAAIFALIFIIFSKLKKNFIMKMSTILYSENNPDLFIEKLNSFEGKLFINKKIRLFRLIDAYAIKQDNDKVIELFKELETKKLSFGQQVSLYEKEVSFYVQNKMYEEAKKANEVMQELASKVEIPDLQDIGRNCNALIDVYVNKDGSLAPEMADIGDKANIETVKGTYYFYAAKCYYYRKDAKMVDKYLQKAQKYLISTSMAKPIEECLTDHKCLEKY